MTVSSDETMAYEPAAQARHRMRIDGAHIAERDSSAGESEANASTEELLEVAEEPTPELLAAVAGQTLDARREQFQLQVSQLAGHLRDRLREVDRREAAVNARASQLEADLRASRLWLRERENAFQERESELRRQIEELQDRATPRTGDAGDKVDRHLAESRQ